MTESERKAAIDELVQDRVAKFRKDIQPKIDEIVSQLLSGDDRGGLADYLNGARS